MTGSYLLLPKASNTMDLVHDTQTGFVHGKSIFDIIFSFWKASEWAMQSNQKLALLLLELEKAYNDRVD